MVAGLARDTGRVAGELSALARDLRRLDDVGSAWRVEAASCFRSSLGELPRHLGRAEGSFAAAARELAGWSAELAELQGEAGKTHDYLEGVRAFQGQRAPRFEGR